MVSICEKLKERDGKPSGHIKMSDMKNNLVILDRKIASEIVDHLILLQYETISNK